MNDTSGRIWLGVNSFPGLGLLQPCNWKTLFSLIFLPVAPWQAQSLHDWGPTVPEMIYGSLLYRPFHIPPPSSFCSQLIMIFKWNFGYWTMAHSLEDNCSGHADNRPSIEIYKKDHLSTGIILESPAFPQDPRKCLYFYLKECQVLSLNSEKEGSDRQLTGYGRHCLGISP